MSELAEVKELFSTTQKTLEAVQAKVNEMEGKTADVVDTATLEKMKSELADQLSAEQKANSDRIEKLENAGNRGNAVEAADPDEVKSFVDYMRGEITDVEAKSMSTLSSADGGFMVPTRMSAGIQKRLRRSSPVREVANIVTTSGAYEHLVERDDAGFQWAGETQTRSETDTPTVHKISIEAHELSALPKASQRMLDDADFGIEPWLVAYVADKFSRAEATAFVSGDGVEKPKGFLSYATAAVADDARAVETMQFRATGANGAFNGTNPADVLTKTFYDLQGAYQANATWMMKNTTAADVAVLKDGDGASLIRGLMNADGQIVRIIQGRPLAIADDMPEIATNSLSIAIGDFSVGYTIADGAGFRLLRDPFSAKPFVLFFCTKRVGGGVTDFDAIKFVKFAA